MKGMLSVSLVSRPNHLGPDIHLFIYIEYVHYFHIKTSTELLVKGMPSIPLVSHC